MSFINWGSESPEQLAIRRQIEEQALYEQAVRMAQAKQRAGQAPAVAGGGGDPYNGLWGLGANGRIYSMAKGEAEWNWQYGQFPSAFQMTFNPDDGFIYAVCDYAGSVAFIRIDPKTREAAFIDNNISDFTVKGASSFYYEGSGSFIYLDNFFKDGSGISSVIRVQLEMGSPEIATATQLAEVDSDISGFLLRNLFLYEGTPWAIGVGMEIVTGPFNLESGTFVYQNLILPSPSDSQVESIVYIFSALEFKGEVLVVAVWYDGDNYHTGLFKMDTKNGGSIAPYYLKFIKSVDSWSKDNVPIFGLAKF